MSLGKAFSRWLLVGSSMLGASAFAGGYITGNGGGAWACLIRTQQALLFGRQIIWLQFSDLVEARTKYGLQIVGPPTLIPSSLPPFGIDFLDAIDGPVLTKDRPYLRSWYALIPIIYAEDRLREVAPKLFQTYEQVRNGLLARVHYTRSLLPAVPKDIPGSFEPKADSCPRGYIQWVQIADYNDDAQVLTISPIYDQLAPADQAALWLHECLFTALREIEGPQDSTKARMVTGYLLSTKSINAMKRVFQLERIF